MTEVIGVKFNKAGKIYYFDPKEHKVNIGDGVIVKTSRGLEFGYVAVKNTEVEDSEIVTPLKPIVRLATEADFERLEKNKEKEKEAFEIALKKIQEHGLDMKLVNTEYTFDGSKILFYFTADGRIDFRELVKVLQAFSEQELNFARWVCVTRQRPWAQLAFAEDLFVVQLF